MSLLAFAASPSVPSQPIVPSQPVAPAPEGSYRPGVCNIGPAEIERRRRSAIVSTGVTVVVAAVMFALGLPHPVRLLIGVLAAASIVGWLQVFLRFCVGFAKLGVFNFGRLGPMESVADPAAHRADMRRAGLMVGASLIGGLLIGIVAVLLP